jgi:hypothetical protein
MTLPPRRTARSASIPSGWLPVPSSWIPNNPSSKDQIADISTKLERRVNLDFQSPGLCPSGIKLQPVDQVTDASKVCRSRIGVSGGEVSVHTSQYPTGQPQDLFDLDPTDIGQEMLLWPDPARILVAEMSVTVAADRPAGILEGRQQVLGAGRRGT